MAKKQTATPTTTGQYDRIFKQNAEEIYTSLVKAVMSIDILAAENIPQSDLQHTLERKADFLKRIKPDNGEPEYALHIEIQSVNDTKMLKRMLMYDTLIFNQHGIDSEQFVIYIGEEPLTMKSSIERRRGEFSYHIIDIRNYDYEQFLEASTPEQVILAILGDFHQEPPQNVIAKILTRLQQLTTSPLDLGKYATQLGVISQLRKLQQQTLNQIESMPIVFDITQTPNYMMGEAKGEARGEAKGEAKNKIKMVNAMFAEGLSLELIAKVAGLSLAIIHKMYEEWKISIKSLD